MGSSKLREKNGKIWDFWENFSRFRGNWPGLTQATKK